jgi:hypothetical protein
MYTKKQKQNIHQTWSDKTYFEVHTLTDDIRQKMMMLVVSAVAVYYLQQQHSCRALSCETIVCNRSILSHFFHRCMYLARRWLKPKDRDIGGRTENDLTPGKMFLVVSKENRTFFVT